MATSPLLLWRSNTWGYLCITTVPILRNTCKQYFCLFFWYILFLLLTYHLCDSLLLAINDSFFWTNSLSWSRNSPPFMEPKVHYRVHKSWPLVPVLSQVNPVHILIPYFLQIHFNIILVSTLRSPKWYITFRFSTKILYVFLISTTRRYRGLFPWG